MTITYRGHRTDNGCAVVITDDASYRRALPMRLHLANHSPTGFEWGYGGSGPAQLALALLAHALNDGARALRIHQSFKWRVIAKLPRADDWKMTRDEIIREAVAIETETMGSFA